jgi:glycosyltransferase involved in cell wall biosynthesis
MKILHLSTTDIKGGAGIAAYRLHRGLVNAGVVSRMFVQRKYSMANDVFCSKGAIGKSFDFFCAATDKATGIIFGPKNDDITSPALFSSMDLRVIEKIDPDIVHLHWICGEFLSPEKIAKITKPIVWTMHDMWPFSGVSHYGTLNRNNLLDVWTWQRKQRAWNGLHNMTAISPSVWLAREATASNLFHRFRIEHIPNGVDADIFKKYDVISSRNKYGLPLDKKLILFGAVNPLSGERKGYKLLIDIIHELLTLDVNKNVALVVFGSADNHKTDFGLPTYFAGKISLEQDMAELYSAADVFIAPSKEDNLPNTVIESMSCGTPVAAFRIGGMPDMVDDKVNGILVPAFETKTMAKEVISVLGDEAYREKLSIEARKKVLRAFDINVVVEKYSQLYHSLLQL